MRRFLTEQSGSRRGQGSLSVTLATLSDPIEAGSNATSYADWCSRDAASPPKAQPLLVFDGGNDSFVVGGPGMPAPDRGDRYRRQIRRPRQRVRRIGRRKFWR